jgi:hypothetical protein
MGVMEEHREYGPRRGLEKEEHEDFGSVVLFFLA